MSWFKKVKAVYKEPTLEELMDEILADPFVKLEIQMTPLGFRKRQHNDYRDQKMGWTVQNLPNEDGRKFWNIQHNLFGKLDTKTPKILVYEYFYVSLYRFRNKNYAYGVSEKLGLVDLKGIIGMESNEIAKVLGDLDDIDNLRQFMRNNTIDNLL